MNARSRSRLRVLLIALSLVGAQAAGAADLSGKPVHLVVPYPAGGTIDVVARLLGAQLRERWQVPVIVENRVGGNGAVGVEYVMRSAGDGSTLLFNGSPLVTVPHLQRTNYAVGRDLTAIVETAELDFVLTASKRSGITSMEALLARARAVPGRLNYGSGGNGSLPHLNVELLKSVAAIDLTHIPYKGNGLAVQALMAGEVDLTFVDTSSIMPLVRSGAVRALMVTGHRSIDGLAGVPWFDSLYPGRGIDAWHGLFGPAGMASDVVERIAADVRAVLGSSDLSRRFREMGFEPTGRGPAEFTAIVRRDDERWGAVIRANGIRGD